MFFGHTYPIVLAGWLFNGFSAGFGKRSGEIQVGKIYKN